MALLSIMFDGSYESYVEIINWLKEEGNTNALANEIQLRPPLIIMPSMHSGTVYIEPGQFVAKGIDGIFYIGKRL